MVYVVDQAGEVVCVSRDSGQVYWIHDLNDGLKKKRRAIWSSPLLASNRLIVVSSKGNAVALNPKTGAVLKTLRIGSDAPHRPHRRRRHDLRRDRGGRAGRDPVKTTARRPC